MVKGCIGCEFGFEDRVRRDEEPTQAYCWYVEESDEEATKLYR